MPPEMRNPLINYAGTKNRITLISSAFSRGTDFTVYDSDINEKGGMHVIQTYVSKNESDFIQILGRTGRQGKNGSFEMIVTT
jgi:preprotein translocase subunit SecA